MEAITCSVCGGRGCSNCRGSGVLALDEQGRQFYVSQGPRGEMRVVGPKDGASAAVPTSVNFVDRMFDFVLKLTSQPKDLIWAIKILSRRK